MIMISWQCDMQGGYKKCLICKWEKYYNNMISNNEYTFYDNLSI